MSAIPSTFASFKPLAPDVRRDFSAPVTTVTQLRPGPDRKPSPRSFGMFSLPKEPEDARITGGTRSLDRRLLALNFAGPRIPAGR
jgi:hypothetical protein